MKRLLFIFLMPVIIGIGNGVNAEAVSFSFTNENLQIPVVKVEESNAIFDVNMNLLQEEPIEFVLQNVTALSTTASPLATFSIETGTLHIPLVEVNGLKDAGVQEFEADLKLVPNTDPWQFLLTKAIPLNTNAVFEILATKTLSNTDISAKLSEVNEILATIATEIDLTTDISVVSAKNQGVNQCGSEDTPSTLVSLPYIDFDMDGIPDDVGRLMEVSFAKDDVFLATGLQFGIVLPWQIAAFTYGDTLYVTIGVPETLVRTAFRGVANYDRLMSLARTYHHQLRAIIASALENTESVTTNINMAWTTADGTPFELGEPEISAIGTMFDIELSSEFIAPSITIKNVSADQVTAAIETAFINITVADMNRNGQTGEDENNNGITDDQEVLQQAISGFIKNNNPDMSVLKNMLEGATDVWANGQTLQQWNLARTISIGSDEVGHLDLIQLCQPFYGGMALGFGLQHAPAMPCVVGVWEESDGVHINLIDPRFLFAYFFADVQLDPNNEMQQRMGQLFELFPAMVFNELVSVLNVVIEDLGGTEKFELAQLSTAADRFERVRSHVDNWLTTTAAPTISSSDVKAIVDDWANQQVDYQIISIRKPEDYAQGHIPEAINIPFTQIVDDASLSLLELGKTIILYCYTGHTGQIATTILNVLNFDAKNMKFGMMDWNLANFEASGSSKWDGIADYEVETMLNTVAETYSTPVFMTQLNEVTDILKANARDYLNTTINTLKATISSSDLKAIIDDWENQQDTYQILSVRSPEHYASGHVPHAINIPWQQVAQLENLQQLDPNKITIVYCYTGHTGQIATTVLNLLGYQARNLKFGMMDWNLALFEANGKQPWDQQADYPVE